MLYVNLQIFTPEFSGRTQGTGGTWPAKERNAVGVQRFTLFGGFWVWCKSNGWVGGGGWGGGGAHGGVPPSNDAPPSPVEDASTMVSPDELVGERTSGACELCMGEATKCLSLPDYTSR